MSLSVREVRILDYLFRKKTYVTAAELSVAFDVSVRTIKSDIYRMNQGFDGYRPSINIASRPRHGFMLEYENEELIEKFLGKTVPKEDDNVVMLFDTKGRIYYIIRKLLVVNYHVRSEDLMDELYISRTVLTTMLREVRAKLQKYKLKIKSRPHYGLMIEGDESSRRLAIAEYFYHNVPENVAGSANLSTLLHDESSSEYKNIYDLIEKVCVKYQIDLSNYSISNLVIHIIIGIRRVMLYNYNEISDLKMPNILNTIEFKAATEIVQYLEVTYHIFLPIGETIYYANHLETKRILHQISMDSQELSKLNQCITEIIHEINNNFDFNFPMDKELYEHLFLHLPQMIHRLRKNMIARNPMVYDNIRRYLFAAKVTHSACEIIKHFYDVEVEINEFGYLLLYFNMAIFQFESSKPLNIAILSARGRPEALMYLNEIKEVFPSRKFHIYEVRHIEENTQADLVISTFKSNVKTSYPTFYIEGDDYISKLKERIYSLRYQSFDINKYVKPLYFTAELEGETKEEVFRNLFRVLIEKNLLKIGDLKKVKMMDSEIGNGVIHFQDTLRLIKEGMLYVCILKKPVFWETSLAKILIISKTKKADDKDLYNFCRIISLWVSDKSSINRLIKERTFSTLYDDLVRAKGETK